MLCLREIAAIEAELLAGNPDVAGLCLALSDWWTELRLICGLEQEKPPGRSPTARSRIDDQSLIE